MNQTTYEIIETGIAQEYRSYQRDSLVVTVLEITNQNAADVFGIEGPTFYQVIVQTPYNGYRQNYRTLGGLGVFNESHEAVERAEERMNE